MPTVTAMMGLVADCPLFRSFPSESHTVFRRRRHIVRITKYRYKLLEGVLRDRIQLMLDPLFPLD